MDSAKFSDIILPTLNIPANSRRRMPTPTRSSFVFVAAIFALATACSREPGTPRTGSPLAHPSAELLAERAPDTVRVRFETTKGPFVVEAYRAWSPHGVDRFYQLVHHGFYDDVRFFRVLSGFMAQFGLHGDPSVTAAWHDRTIPDDPVVHSNARGTITFATRGENTRTTQLFINYRDNANLDAMGFTPFGIVTEGMNVVDSLYSGYGEGAPEGQGPDQDRASSQGNAYLQRDFPKLDYITKATLLTPPAASK
jgi:peptidyl-prolyl cis-trans isomerase A (cyclophilin A)